MKTLLVGTLALAYLCGCAVTPSEAVLNDEKTPAEQHDGAAGPCVAGTTALPPCNQN
jgi:hypothetical protein